MVKKSITPRERRYGTGTISVTPSGTYRAEIMLTGQRHTRRFSTEAQAHAYLNTLLESARAGMNLDADRMTIADLFAKFLAWTESGGVGPTPRDNYEMLARLHIVPHLGKMRVKELRPDHLEQHYFNLLNGTCKVKTGGRKAKLAASTVHKIHLLIENALNRARKWRIVSENVAEVADTPKIEAAETRFWTGEEVVRFLQSISGERWEAAYWIGLCCGLRRGEILGLHCDDIDLDNAVLTVRRTLSRLGRRKGLHVGPTKSAESKRRVPIPAVAVERLRLWHAQQVQQRETAGSAWQETESVFTTHLGTPIEPRNFNRDMERLIRKFEMRSLHVHGMRHTFATTLFAHRLDTRIIQAMLGHSSPALTDRLYKHLVRGMEKQAADVMDRVIRGPGTGT